MNLSQIRLTRQEHRLLKMIERKQQPHKKLNKQLFGRLLHYGLVHPYSDEGGETMVEVSDFGLDYLSYRRGLSHDNAILHLWDILFVVLGAILTLIAQHFA